MVSPQLFRKASGRKDPRSPARHTVECGWTRRRQTSGFEERAVSRTQSDGEASFGH